MQNTSGSQPVSVAGTEPRQDQSQIWLQVTSRQKKATLPAGPYRMLPASHANRTVEPKMNSKPTPPRAPKTAAITVTVTVWSNTT